MVRTHTITAPLFRLCHRIWKCEYVFSLDAVATNAVGPTDYLCVCVKQQPKNLVKLRQGSNFPVEEEKTNGFV